MLDHLQSRHTLAKPCRDPHREHTSPGAHRSFGTLFRGHAAHGDVPGSLRNTPVRMRRGRCSQQVAWQDLLMCLRKEQTCTEQSDAPESRLASVAQTQGMPRSVVHKLLLLLQSWRQESQQNVANTKSQEGDDKRLTGQRSQAWSRPATKDNMMWPFPLDVALQLERSLSEAQYKAQTEHNFRCTITRSTSTRLHSQCLLSRTRRAPLRVWRRCVPTREVQGKA